MTTPNLSAQSHYQIPPTVRAVLFDAVGTLIYPRPSVAEAYLAAGRRFGSGLTIDQVRERFRAAFQRQEDLDRGDPAFRTSEEHERRRWRTIVGEVFDDVEDGQGLFEALWRHFALAGSWSLFGDVPECWERLERAGLMLGIASNFDARLGAIAAALPPLSQSRYLFVSSQIGCRKPCVDFFRAIERSLDLRPEQLLLVGDDLENDYDAARAAAWHAVLLRRVPATPSRRENFINSLANLQHRT